MTMRAHSEDNEHPVERRLLAEGIALLALIVVAVLALLAALAIQAQAY